MCGEIRLKRFELNQLRNELAPPAKPALMVSPGETFIVETEDAFGGQIRTEKDWTDSSHRAPTISGPIFVEGAEESDTLTVDIKDIQPLRGYGVTRINVPNLPRLREGPLAELAKVILPPAHWVRICPIRGEKVYWSEKITLPYKPMIGTIGTFDSAGKGTHGGNMDLTEVTIGNRIYLPVSVKGAYLYLGDVHAVQGEGELCGTAVEMASVVTLTVDIVKNKVVGGPRIESKDYLAAVGRGRTAEDAIETAFTQLILWLEEDYGIDRWDGYNLCTQAAEVDIGYYLQCFVAAKFPKKYLPKS